MLKNDDDAAPTDKIVDWVSESQRGNIRAFELLYREFYQRLFLFCRRMSGNTQGAEEAVQESFIKAWQALPQFRQESHFYTWLRKIAARLLIDKARLKQEKIWQNRIDLEDEHFAKEVQLHANSNRQGHLEINIDLEKLIALLPEGARNILIMHDIEGYQHQEIAELMGIATGTSKAQLSRARSLLRKNYSSVSSVQLKESYSER